MIDLVRRAGRPVHEALLFVIGRGTTPWVINGETFRIDPRYRNEMGPVHEPAAAALLTERVRPGAVCFNVGANLGAHVLQMARRIGPSGRIVAFEPNPAAARILDRHVRANGCADRVMVVESAVGAVRGRAAFFAQGVDQRARLGSANPGLAGPAATLTVDVESLDDWAKAHRLTPDWLIVDVEGFEEAVLAGAAELIAGHPAIGIVIEFHPDAWSDAGTTRASMAALLTRLGRRAVSLDGLSDPLSGYNQAVLEAVPLI